jgi:hypothetical protein
MGEFFISSDLGQVNDYTAITIFESFLKDSGAEYHLRHIERPERGTTYPAIVDRIKELGASRQLAESYRTVAIDVTGCGRPVWDLLKQSFRGTYARLRGISITGGNTVTEENNIINVPKRDLVSALQVAFQNKQLKIAPVLPEAGTLIKELTNFKVKINLNGHDQYEAWREGIHDDIVLSAAMGVWLASQFYRSHSWIKNLI